MIGLGVAAMLVTLDPWLDVLVENVIIGATSINFGFIVIKWLNLNWQWNKLAKHIHSCFSLYLALACATIILNLLNTGITVFIVDTNHPLHFIMQFFAVAAFVMTHLSAMTGGYHGFISTRSKMEASCGGDEAGATWRFDCPISDDNILVGKSKPDIRHFFKATGIGAMLLLLAIAIYGPFIFLTAGTTFEYYIAGNLSIFGTSLILPVIFLLARQVPRTKMKLHRGILIVIIVTSSTVATINAVPFLTSSSAVTSLEMQFNASFGTSWRNTIPASTSNHFRHRPVALKDIILTIPIPAVDEQFDIPYMQDKGRTLRFDWYAPRGASMTSNKLPTIIALHPGSWRYLDKGAWNVVPTSRYIADQGFIVIDAQYGLHDDSAGAFTMRDMIMEIGTLTRFLEANADTYHVDLSRTYFLGRSAGGQLALVAGMAYQSPYFAGNFSTVLECRGIIAFYPPSDLKHLNNTAGMKLFGVPMEQMWHFNPVNLTTPTSPPALLFHGTSDDVVPIRQSEYLQQQMRSNGRTCILGTLSGGGHLFDLFYNNFYNQICVYYVERFLVLTDG